MRGEGVRLIKFAMLRFPDFDLKEEETCLLKRMCGLKCGINTCS